MDINLIRSLITLAAFLSFLAIVCWAYSTPLERHANLGEDE